MPLPGFGPPRWADVAAPGAGGGGGRKEGQGQERNGQQQQAQRTRKIEFKWKLEIEKARISRGKKESNYLIFVNKESDIGYEDEVIADVLEKVGINFDSVISMNKDPERRAATEILLKPDVQVDMTAIHRMLEDKKVPFNVEHIGFRIEVMHVRRLGLTADPETTKDQIRDTILPFVDKVVDVEATKWFVKDADKNSKSFRAFNGKLDGNYRVRVVPKENVTIPGFIPVGPEMVRGEVVYHVGKERNLLCSACFQKDHLRGDVKCNGGKGWAASF